MTELVGWVQMQLDPLYKCFFAVLLPNTLTFTSFCSLHCWLVAAVMTLLQGATQTQTRSRQWLFISQIFAFDAFTNEIVNSSCFSHHFFFYWYLPLSYPCLSTTYLTHLQELAVYQGA